MKTILPLCIGAMLVTSAGAAFTTWTNSDGKKAELELVSVSGDGDERVGVDGDGHDG